ncbi:MAG: polysaccharide deacetylase family protein [Methanomassiliicoccales archaeon]|nr:polysaccharide deacetylase family protein [Methanomassiliicoccales archaeon]
MRAVAFTVDVDRDVNLACQGQSCSVSKEMDGKNTPRFTSSARGLERLVELFRDTEVKGTFFWEGRSAEVMSRDLDLSSLMKGHEVALHGYDHEDFSGKETGVVLDREQVRDVLDRAEAALNKVFGQQKKGFRAPYQRTSGPLLQELAEKNYLYDSSETVRLEDGVVQPYRRENGLPEAPVCWTMDHRGKRIVSYLWPFHEGKRPIEDYLELLNEFEDGLLVVATHSWHPLESYCAGIRTKEEADRGLEGLRRLIEHAQGSGAHFVRLADYLRSWNDL